MAGGTLEWLFIVGGVVMIAIGAAGLRGPTGPQRNLDGLVGVLGIWSIVEAIVFAGSALEWVSFATALLGALLAVAGLVTHEFGTERVVHELSVTGADREGSLTS